MIKYFEGMKYMLAEDYTIQTPITNNPIVDKWFHLCPSGSLTVRAGFGWDGASGPTIDTKTSMSASLVHDVFCICMRDGRLDYKKYQDKVNAFFYKMCCDAGMWEWRAALWHTGVELGDAGNPKQGKDRPVMEAP